MAPRRPGEEDPGARDAGGQESREDGDREDGVWESLRQRDRDRETETRGTSRDGEMQRRDTPKETRAEDGRGKPGIQLWARARGTVSLSPLLSCSSSSSSSSLAPPRRGALSRPRGRPARLGAQIYGGGGGGCAGEGAGARSMEYNFPQTRKIKFRADQI